jgi:hypothetical protein
MTATKMTKVQAAKQIVESNPEATRAEIVQMFMSQLGMSKAGATTYGYNLAKNAPKRVKKMAEAIVQGAAKKAKKVREIVINEEATAILHAPDVTVLPGVPEEQTAEQEEMYNEAARKLAAKRERDAARKREKRAAEKAAKAAAQAA